MMLIEAAPVADAVLPVEAFKAHLRLGSGFGTDSVQDAVLTGFLRAALVAIEGRIGKALIARAFRYVVPDWAQADAQVLPVAPVVAISELALADRQGVETPVAVDRYWLEQDVARPRVRSVGPALPAIPVGGSAVLSFEAGFGPVWEDVPADLQQAVLMLAGHYYEFRNDMGRSADSLPFGVVSLIERYRVLRLGRGVPV